ncbi:MAG: AAA family ATPase [Alphaproteobacteria bacterium]|jgi:ATP-dependent exoDNAse (exonuclease V) alpha subunit|nr:AAA family ATPase [Alphaproteobacteria bacterium]MBT5389108.1 AAA family ATPase [Alphaproteobacteria bacterium]MBT5654003.1 AAA family ATPase [Alphaproteobacteria bacterium]
MTQEIGIPCHTLHSLKYSWDKYDKQKELVESGKLWGRPYLYAFNKMKQLEKSRFTKNPVIIVDEANMIGSTLWEPFLREAATQGAKVLIVQDIHQIKSREPGDMARLFAERFGCIETKEVMRQRVKWQKECSALLNDTRVLDGLTPYYDKGYIKWFDDKDQTIQALTNAYLSDIKENPHQTRIALSYRNSDVFELNQQIRNALKEQGHLQDTFKLEGVEFAIGDKIRFTRNDQHSQFVKPVYDNPIEFIKGQFQEKVGVKNGTFGTITSFEPTGQVKVGLDQGRVVKFDRLEYAHISYGYAMSIHKSEGSTFDQSFVLPDPLMDPSTLLVAIPFVNKSMDF